MTPDHRDAEERVDNTDLDPFYPCLFSALAMVY